LAGLGTGASAGRAPAKTSARSDPAAREVKRALDALQAWVKGHGGQLSAAILSVDTGQLLAAAGEQLALNPASNIKLVTAAAALGRLGPDYRFTTGLYGRLRDGRVDDLALRGHGDPSLSAEHLWEMSERLASMGVREVKRLWVDQSRFDDQFVPPGFGQQPNEWAAFRAPVSAVAIDRNAITLHVLPTVGGRPARVWFDPPGAVNSSGSVETRPRGTGQDVLLSLSGEGGGLRAQVGGHAAEGLPLMSFTKRVDDPRLVPGLVLRHQLERFGVKVESDVSLGGESVAGRLVVHRSARLGVLVQQLGKESDNFYAEMLLKALGAETKGEPATSEAGAAAVRDWLVTVGATSSTTRITNGSGLFDTNRISALELARVLRAAYRDASLGPEYVSQLAVAGVDGTLEGRFRSPLVRGRVRAKTGTLATVDALSGYAMAPNAAMPVALALVVNGINDHRATRQHLDRVVEAVAAHLWRR
jgi:D-alanyl-D-alanine carboxypeptidase/D-alanyl-D-alanine-endopeptidase (penicillin-binding protein 4)